MKKITVEQIEKVKDIMKYKNYQCDNLGGEWIYNGYGSNYKRNKRNIVEFLRYDNRYFTLYEILEGYYNKAIIYKEDGKENYILLSYETVVAEYKEGKMVLYGYYSRTTSNHINSFLRKFNYLPMSKKEIEKMENIEF